MIINRTPLVLVEDDTSRVLIVDDEQSAIRTYSGTWKARPESESEVVMAVELNDFRQACANEAAQLIAEMRNALGR